MRLFSFAFSAFKDREFSHFPSGFSNKNCARCTKFFHFFKRILKQKQQVALILLKVRINTEQLLNNNR